MKTLLVPIDFSKESIHALEVAAKMARKTNASIQLLHILEVVNQPAFVASGEYLPPDPMDRIYMLKQIEKAEEALQDIQSEYLQGVNASYIVKAGEVFPTIEQYLEESKTDLVVMGTKGSSTINEILVGSNTEKVVRKAKCPVLTVSDEVKEFDIRKVLVPTDLETASKPFFDHLVRLQSYNQFDVQLLYVNTPLNFRSTCQIEDKMRKFLKKFPLENVSFHILQDYSQEEGIHYFALKSHPDLIAMLTHQRRGLSHFLSGSITEEVIHRTITPVLTYGVA
jgi:nucleotide-binding universal stress UspA family protein